MSDWYHKGSTPESRERAEKAASSFMPQRLWLREEEQKRIIVVDDEDFCLWEHQLKINGSWGNFYTCPNMNGETACPLCLSGHRKQYTGFVTVIDTTGYTKKDGTKGGKYFRYLFAMPPKVLKRFVALRDMKTSLVGAIIDIKRTSNDAPRLGDIWDIVSIDANVLKDEKLAYKKDGKTYLPEPYDYAALFAPKNENELRILASGSGSNDANDANSSGKGDGFTGSGDYTPPSGGKDKDALY